MADPVAPATIDSGADDTTRQDQQMPGAALRLIASSIHAEHSSPEGFTKPTHDGPIGSLEKGSNQPQHIMAQCVLTDRFDRAALAKPHGEPLHRSGVSRANRRVAVRPAAPSRGLLQFRIQPDLGWTRERAAGLADEDAALPLTPHLLVIGRCAGI
jgi:hypothetical protein